MKTPEGIKEDWHLDNYVGKKVKIEYIDEKHNFEGIFLDENSRGIFIQRIVNSKSNEVWYLPNGTYKRIGLPELAKPENKKHEELK